ncbi:MalY/PatB family protein [Bifidobacterium magnum]|uniref:cysteine-S-conjugate beta-lyase n=1 Tax=Bifidobacterium magnum TaxID=1692 RepID=A0A087BE84_9BIFI|nr:MalY/PatB family protein [Bifidobacterium magnum]KFI69334.1 Aminotransferase [Bifidobacterium magnum]
MTPEQRAWFDEPVDRSGTNSLKWDVMDGELPLWVADMDFRTAPAITQAIEKRAAHAIYGYSIIPDEWNAAYVDWWGSRHHLALEPEWLAFANGVMPIMSSCVRKLTTPAENVVVQTPVYNIFFNSIVDNGRNMVENPLVYDRATGRYSVDFEDLERKLADPQTTMMFLCNPHNPVGAIWNEDTLRRIGQLCLQYGVTVVEDSIHCDITDPGYEYVPLLSVDPEFTRNTIMCVAPTKAFNMAGLQTACAVVPDPLLRHKVRQALHTDGISEPNAFAVQATVAAFREGADWLDAMREYVADNRALVREFLAEHLPLIRLIPSHATYVLWLDCADMMPQLEPGQSLGDDLRATTGLFLTNGAQYGGASDAFLRMNIACPQSTLREALAALERYFKAVRL